MGDKPYVSVRFELPQLKEMLDKKLADCPEKELLSECLFSIVMDHNALEHLAHAVMGVKPSVDYTPGDEVMVVASGLSDWRFNSDLMKERGMIVNGQMKATITIANPWKSYPYSVSYQYLDKESGQLAEISQEISESYIKGYAEEFPEDLI